MAGPWTCWNLWQNPLPTGKDEFARVNGEPAFINESGTSASTFVVLYGPTPALLLALALAKLVAKYTNEDLQKAIKLILELFIQGQQ